MTWREHLCDTVEEACLTEMRQPAMPANCVTDGVGSLVPAYSNLAMPRPLYRVGSSFCGRLTKTSTGVIEPKMVQSCSSPSAMA